jgi:hypothetical protein
MAHATRPASQHGRRVAHAVVSTLALATYSVAGIVSAQAQCAGSGGSNAATDASTAQTLELIRDRRMQVAQSCPAGTAPSASGACVAISSTQSAATAPNAPGSSPAAQTKKPPRPVVASGAAPGGSGVAPGGYGSLKDDPVVPLRTVYGTWAEGYGDYDRRDNVSPSDQTIRFRSYGVLAGIDHTYLRSPREGIMIGGLAGYNQTKGEFSAGTAPPPNDAAPKSQDIEGAMLGLYATYFHNRFAMDFLVKTDLFDLEQRALTTCATGVTGSTNLTNYVVASNIYYRHDLGRQLWWEPTFGIRYVQTDFGGGAAAIGLSDGNALRLQAGARIGTDWMTADRRFWTVSFLAAIYSDVVVNGFTATTPGGVTLDTDEGKVRALGQLRAKVTTGGGVSYYGQVEVRGGEDYWGVGGKAGLRYEW